MKKIKNKTRLLVTFLFLVFLISSFHYAKRYIQSYPASCQEGDSIERLRIDDIIYLECGVDEIWHYDKVIENNSIINKKIVTTEKESHIEMFKANWTNESKYDDRFTLAVLLMLFSLIVLCLLGMSWCEEWKEKGKEKKKNKKKPGR